MNYHVMTLFPEVITQATGFSILKRAQEESKIAIKPYDIRDYSTNKHNKVDDYPFGGGFGMVMSPEPVVLCHREIMKNIKGTHRTIFMSPKGRKLNQGIVNELLQYDNLILLCGHYEGIDQRAIDLVVDEEISIGDYVLTGGEIPAIALIEATARLVENVLVNPESHQEESFNNSMLEYPQYTRPREFEGHEVPGVLLSGNHKQIEDWRFEQSLRITLERRSDLLELEFFVPSLNKNQLKILDKVLNNK